MSSNIAADLPRRYTPSPAVKRWAKPVEAYRDGLGAKKELITMKAGITVAVSVLALLSLAGCASKTQSVSASDLLYRSLAGGQHLVWDFERVQLDAQQASALSASANGDSLMLAAKIVEQRALASPTPASIPVALTCSQPNLVVITSEALTPKYVEQGCTIVRQV